MSSETILAMVTVAEDHTPTLTIAEDHAQTLTIAEDHAQTLTIAEDHTPTLTIAEDPFDSAQGGRPLACGSLGLPYHNGRRQCAIEVADPTSDMLRFPH